MNEADKNEKLDADILESKADILRAQDVMPPYNNEEIEVVATEIPRFDLAEEIMAEQRKITAIKRKSPEKKMGAEARPAVRPFRYALEPQRLTASGQEDIIAEIVARDIKRLCGEN